MIKRVNNKKKKGFTLIELIIVLAVMAIIALIAIPNFTAVRDNSKIKADKQSCETIERTVLMLVSDETVTVSEDVTVTVSFNADKTFKDAVPVKADKITGIDELKSALAKVKEPQAGPGFAKNGKATVYEIKITSKGDVTSITK
ncbi:type II secretion system protein [Clostridium sp.]|uniref:type II secretion system protein n=1 Tax=Clostridium sp. TaxID=1506 RepID=UPI0034649493